MRRVTSTDWPSVTNVSLSWATLFSVIFFCRLLVRSECYYRLLFSDYLVTRFYFDDERKYSPADLTNLRSATVKNATFGVLAVRHDFKRFFKFRSSLLIYWLQKFIRIQGRNNHQIPDDVSCCIIFILKFHLMASLWQYVWLDFYDSLGVDISCDVEVPKAYSNLFKSVAGAIFIDSGMSLEAVWESYYRLLHQEMGNSRFMIMRVCNINLYFF